MCDVEFHGESENQIRFRIAFSVLFGIHFEQHAVFTIFGHFWPHLANIDPLLQSNLNKTWLTHTPGWYLISLKRKR